MQRQCDGSSASVAPGFTSRYPGPIRISVDTVRGFLGSTRRAATDRNSRTDHRWRPQLPFDLSLLDISPFPVLRLFSLPSPLFFFPPCFRSGFWGRWRRTASIGWLVGDGGGGPERPATVTPPPLRFFPPPLFSRSSVLGLFFSSFLVFSLHELLFNSFFGTLCSLSTQKKSSPEPPFSLCFSLSWVRPPRSLLPSFGLILLSFLFLQVFRAKTSCRASWSIGLLPRPADRAEP